MAIAGPTTGQSIEAIQAIIAELQAELANAQLSDSQRAAIEARLALYVELTKTMKDHVFSLMHGEGTTPKP